MYLLESKSVWMVTSANVWLLTKRSSSNRRSSRSASVKTIWLLNPARCHRGSAADKVLAAA